jgi:hypothetical protein
MSTQTRPTTFAIIGHPAVDRPRVPAVRSTGQALTRAGERARRRRDREARRRPPSGLLPSGGRTTVVTAERRSPVEGTWQVSRRMRLAATATVGFALVVLTWQLVGGSTPNHTEVTVHPGDTLFSIAQSVRPEADPRAMAQQIRSINGLVGDRIVPGQHLDVPVAG